MNIINLMEKPILFEDADGNQLMVNPTPDIEPRMPSLHHDCHGHIATSEGVQIPVYRNYLTRKKYEQRLNIPDPKPDTIYVLDPFMMSRVGNMITDGSRDDIYVPDPRSTRAMDERGEQYILSSTLFNVKTSNSVIIPRYDICEQTTDMVINNVTHIVNLSRNDYKFVNAASKGRKTILYVESDHKHKYHHVSGNPDEKIVNIENVNFTLRTRGSLTDVNDLLSLISDERPDTIYLMPRELVNTDLFSIFKNRNDIFIPAYLIERDTSRFFFGNLGGVKTLGDNDELIFEVNCLVSAFKVEIKN